MNITDCLDYCSNFVNVDEAHKELDTLTWERDRSVWFLAQLINERAALKEGYSMPVRWQCLRGDLRQLYVDEARKIISEWWADEESARSSREESDRRHAHDYEEFMEQRGQK